MGGHTQSPTGTTSHLLDHPAWGEQGPQAAEEGARAGDLYMPPLSHRIANMLPTLLYFPLQAACSASRQALHPSQTPPGTWLSTADFVP